MGRIPPRERYLWALVFAGLVLDVALTYVGLDRGLTEGNPVMRAAINAGGFGTLGLSKALVVGVGGVVRAAFPEYGPAVPAGIALPWLCAATVNFALVV